MKASAHRKPLVNAHSLPLVSSAGMHFQSCHPWGRGSFPRLTMCTEGPVTWFVWHNELPFPLGRGPGPVRFWPQFQELPHGLIYFLSAVSYISQETHLFLQTSSLSPHPAALSLERWFGQVGSFASLPVSCVFCLAS